MVSYQTEYSRFEQKSVIKFFVAQKYKPWEINRRVSDMYGETCFCQKDLYK